MARLGCRVPNMGELPGRHGLAEMARVAEDAGADAAHLSDHVVLPERTESRYPFTPDGSFPFPCRDDWYDVLTSCAWIAASTSSLEVGPSVLVLPQRHPLEVAKTAATLSRLSGGRLFLGVGAGWLREEFDALGRDFDNRVTGMNESIRILRDAWEGDADGFDGEVWDIPSGLHCRPLPDSIPLLIGGMSKSALRRAAANDGWIALVGADADLDALERKVRALRDLRAEAGDDGPFRTVVRVMSYGGSADETAASIRELVAMGFDEVVIDPGWDDLVRAGELIGRARAVIDAL